MQRLQIAVGKFPSQCFYRMFGFCHKVVLLHKKSYIDACLSLIHDVVPMLPDYFFCHSSDYRVTLYYSLPFFRFYQQGFWSSCACSNNTFCHSYFQQEWFLLRMRLLGLSFFWFFCFPLAFLFTLFTFSFGLFHYKMDISKSLVTHISLSYESSAFLS